MIIEGSLNPRMTFRRTEKICEGAENTLLIGIEMNEVNTDVMLVIPMGISIKN